MEKWLIEHQIGFRWNHKIGNFRPDFIIDDNIILELDGLFYHQEAEVPSKEYHQLKRSEYLSKGYIPLFFREDEIYNKFHIVTSIILNKLGKSNRIFARKCSIKEISKYEANKFFIENHLMGAGIGRTIGLYYDDQLVCALRFIVKKHKLVISRFASLINNSVIGGFSKILKYIINLYKPTIVENFVDLRYGTGNHLTKLGFVKIREQISFQWTDFKQTFHRMKFRGNSGIDIGLAKIWDCGQANYQLRCQI